MRRLVVLLALLTGCAEFYPTPPRPLPPNDFCAVPNFDGNVVEVDENGSLALMLRFAAPTKSNLACMRDMYKLTDVFQLDLGRDPAVDGITNHYHPLSVLTATEEEVDAVLADAERTCSKPGKVCAFHCAHGQDRTGLLFALWIWKHIDHSPRNLDVLYADMMRHGFHPYKALWSIFTKKVGW